MKEIFTTFRAFKYRNFRLFFPGLAISQIGIWVQNIAVSWLVYEITKSPLAMGSVLGINTIPLLILTPFSGILADKYNRKKLLLIVQILYTVQALIMALLTANDLIGIWNIIILGMLLNATAAIDAPLRQSTFVLLVDNKEDLNNAIFLNASCFNLARLVGPSLGGILIAKAGISFCFFINFICLIPSIFLISKMKIEDKKSEHIKNETIFEGLKEGFSYLSKHPEIYILQIFLTLFVYLAMSYPLLLPIYTKDVLNSNADTLGLLMGCIGVGALLSSLLLASKKSKKGLKYIIVSACTLSCICLILAGIYHNIYLVAILMFLFGMGVTACVTPQNSLIQSVVDDEMRGRVLSINSICFLGTTSLSSFTIGTIAEFFGISHTFIIIGISLLIFNFIFGRKYIKFNY